MGLRKSDQIISNIPSNFNVNYGSNVDDILLYVLSHSLAWCNVAFQSALYFITMVVIECLACARPNAMTFICILSLSPHNTPIIWLVL